MSKPNGGPAFPAIIPFEHSDAQGKDYPIFTESGMTLRDWFAGRVITGIIPCLDPVIKNMNGAAELAYQIADAMLEERKR